MFLTIFTNRAKSKDPLAITINVNHIITVTPPMDEYDEGRWYISILDYDHGYFVTPEEAERIIKFLPKAEIQYWKDK